MLEGYLYNSAAIEEIVISGKTDKFSSDEILLKFSFCLFFSISEGKQWSSSALWKSKLYVRSSMRGKTLKIKNGRNGYILRRMYTLLWVVELCGWEKLMRELEGLVLIYWDGSTALFWKTFHKCYCEVVRKKSSWNSFDFVEL